MSTLGAIEVVATHYCEFTCLRDAEISTGFLMGRLMHALHLTLVNATSDGQSCPFGVTFPDYRPFVPVGRSIRTSGNSKEDLGVDVGTQELSPPIGARVRVFSRSEQELDAITWSKSMRGLDDYVHRTNPRSTPSTVTRFAAFARRQPKASPERLIRRAMKRHSIDEAEARRRYEGYSMDRCKLPWVDMRSESSQDRFRLFVSRIELPATPGWGFSTYGLSSTISLPLF